MIKLFLISTFIFISSIFAANFPTIFATIQINVNFDFVNAFEEFKNDKNAFNIHNVQLKTLSEKQNGLCYEPKNFGYKGKIYCTFKFSDNTKFGQLRTTKTMDLSFDVEEKKTGKVIKVKKAGEKI